MRHFRSRRVGLTRRRTAALGAVMAIVVGLLATSAPVGATTGVDDYPDRLKNAAQDSLVDPWSFYNRECTSFVAWRLNHDAGIAFTNWYDGHHWGDAAIWKQAALDSDVPVDGSPRVGAVAWWAQGSPGSSRGHVAWVMAVSSSSITIEEYNYLHAGRYDQRTISESSSSWPTAFIHVGDVSLQNTARPTVTGVPQVGVKLTASPGTWSPADATFSYQWYAAGVPVTGATRRAFTPGADQLGKRLRVQVTATAGGGQTEVATSTATPSTRPGDLGLTAAPTITGTPRVGVQLSATTGTWSTKASYTYQWRDSAGVIPGATSSTFSPSPAELGQPLQVIVTATRDGYSTAQAASPATPVVQPGSFNVQQGPTISGDAQVDKTLVASAGSWSPQAEPTFQWLVDGAPVSGATGSSYTPSAADVRKQVAVQISLAQPGYESVTEVSAATSEVVPGTFTNSRDAVVSGTPKVGQTLTADPGGWSPEPTLSWQWTADGAPIPGATESAFSPSPAQLGKALAVTVTARRPGYLTSVVESPATQAVLPGVNSVIDPPAISADEPQVGSALTATPGTWAAPPASIVYQWYASGQAVAGATSSTFTPTQAQLDQTLTVRVTARADGYEPLTSSSAATSAVVLGQATFAATPAISGSPVVGQTLEVSAAPATPSTATTSYEWRRDGVAIDAADGPTYTLQTRDVGHRVTASVTLVAPHWAPTSDLVRGPGVVKAVPRITTRVAAHTTSANLYMRVAAPGLRDPQGEIRVYEHHRLLDTLVVTDHRAHARLQNLSAGKHRLVLRYRGPGPQIAASARVAFTIG
jgi:surface antigen